MKRLVIFASIALVAAGVVMADPAEGIWKTEVDDGSYAPAKRTKCGSNICKIIARAFNAGGECKSSNNGKMLF